MSLTSQTTDYPPVCDYCGTEIEDLDQDCPALDKGVCRP